MDELFEEAARLVFKEQIGSTSMLQRKMKLGYFRATRIAEELESAGIVGPTDGVKPRNVLVKDEQKLNVIIRSVTK
jgi:S-DNA-T family DNA segregation ATPase FtsK/SpoIIIE